MVENPYRFLVLASNESHARPAFDKWQDVTGTRYHFPNIYRNRIVAGRDFIYYKGVRRKNGRRAVPEYFGRGRIGAVYPDETTTSQPKAQWHWLCDIEHYQEFTRPLPFKDDQGYYVELDSHSSPKRYWETGVRSISERTFHRVLAAAGTTLKPPSAPAPQTPVAVTVVTEPLGLFRQDSQYTSSNPARCGKNCLGRRRRRRAGILKIAERNRRSRMKSKPPTGPNSRRLRSPAMSGAPQPDFVGTTISSSLQTAKAGILR